MRYILQCVKWCSSSAFLKTFSYEHNCRRSFTIPKPLPDPAILNIISDRDKKDFESYYEFILREVVEGKLITPIQKVNDELEKILNYNVPSGRKLRPYLMIATYKFFSAGEVQSPEKLKMMNILAWFIEMINAAFVMQDDLTDNSETRRSKPTWFKCVGTKAQNDSLLLGAVSLKILRKYFSHHRNFREMLDIYFEMMEITEAGLTLEAITSLEEFTEDRYNDIARQKMGFFLFNFTTTMGTLLAERQDLLISDTAGKVFEELAKLYTIQNDYMDCYGENITGKQGADIQEGQCTWLIISALRKATKTQKYILENSYGSHNANDVNRIKQIYDELGIRNDYESIVGECFQRTMAEVNNICNEHVCNFCKMLVKIFFRIE